MNENLYQYYKSLKEYLEAVDIHRADAEEITLIIFQRMILNRYEERRPDYLELYLKEKRVSELENRLKDE